MLARVQACSLSPSLHTLFTGQREREREKEGGRQRKRERCRLCSEVLFIFLKGMTGALAPLSYLVNIIIRHAD
jgi:hypothetical protein